MLPTSNKMRRLSLCCNNSPQRHIPMIARSDSVSWAELFRLHHLLLFLHHKVTRGILTSSSVSELTLPALTVCMFSQFNTQKTKIIQWNIFPSKKFFFIIYGFNSFIFTFLSTIYLPYLHQIKCRVNELLLLHMLLYCEATPPS